MEISRLYAYQSEYVFSNMIPFLHHCCATLAVGVTAIKTWRCGEIKFTMFVGIHS